MYKEKDGKNPIYIRLIVNRKKVEFTTGVWVFPQQWDDEKQTIIDKKRDKDQHRRIIELESQINQIINHRLAKGLEVSAEIVKGIIRNKITLDSHSGSNDDFIEYYNRHVSIIEKNKSEYTKPTINHYRTALSHFEEFLKSVNKKIIFLFEIDSAVLQKFDDFLLTWIHPKLKRSMNRATANKYHNKLRAVLHRAKREKLITMNPYDDFPLKHVKFKSDNLINQEISRLIKYRTDNESLDRIRDFLVFTIFSGGMRFSDVITLKTSNLFEEDGFYFLLKEGQEKTNESVHTPLLPPAIQILEKYKDEREKTGFLLPRISHQKLNEYLKTLADNAGIIKHMTHKIARHTFGTTICGRNSVPRHLTAAWLGHVLKGNSTDIYTQVTKEESMKHLKILFAIYSGQEYEILK
jgi:site-specific recombinase XerD